MFFGVRCLYRNLRESNRCWESNNRRISEIVVLGRELRYIGSSHALPRKYISWCASSRRNESETLNLASAIRALEKERKSGRVCVFGAASTMLSFWEQPPPVNVSFLSFSLWSPWIPPFSDLWCVSLWKSSCNLKMVLFAW